MAEPAFTLRLLSPDGTAEEHDTVAVVAPGEMGYLGILAHHAPLVTTLTHGRLVCHQPDGQTRQWTLSGGLLEVRDNVVTVLTSAATHAASATPS